MDVQVKRVYEAPEESDGFRILTDRLWPRGISKEKSIAPSTELRKWFGHDPEKFEKFKKRYAEELSGNPDTEKFISLIREELQKGPVTLLYGAKDEIHNQAVVLKEFLKDK
mgnify:CR=1 FL=1